MLAQNKELYQKRAIKLLFSICIQIHFVHPKETIYGKFHPLQKSVKVKTPLINRFKDICDQK